MNIQNNKSEKLSTKEKLFLLVTFFFIAFNIFPLFANISHITSQTACIATVVLLLFIYPQFFISKTTKWMFGYILIAYLLSTVKYIHINGINSTLPAWWRLLIESAWILPSIFIANILTYLNKPTIYKYIAYGSIILLIISFIYILSLLIEFTNVLRDDVLNKDAIRPIGLPDYSLMHAYALTLLPLFLAVKVLHGRQRIAMLLISVLFAFIVIKTYVTTNLFVIFFTLIFVLIYNPQKKQASYLKFFFLVGVALFIYYSGLLLSIVDGLMPFFYETDVSAKLLDFHNSIILGQLTGGTITYRAYLHTMSLESFFSSPIWGGDAIGGHSKVLDILGSMGLLGFIPFAMIIWSNIKNNVRVISDSNIRSYIYISYGIAFIYLYQKGVFGAPSWLFMIVIVPSCLYVLQKRLKQ